MRLANHVHPSLGNLHSTGEPTHHLNACRPSDSTQRDSRRSLPHRRQAASKAVRLHSCPLGFTSPFAILTVAAYDMARINLPPLTRSLLAGQVVFTLLNFALRPNSGWVEKVEQPLVGVGNGVPYLTIVAGRSVIYPWVFALATVVEQNLFGLITSGLTIFYGGRYLERAWGSQEFTKFVMFVAMIPNILSFLLYILGYFITGSGAML
jgi:hypothetical protein